MAAAPVSFFPDPSPTISREVLPSASRHVSLALVQVPGPSHDIEPAPYLRISYNLGPTYSFDASGSGQPGGHVCKRHSLLIIPPDAVLRHDASTPKPAGRSYKPARLATFRISRALLADCAIALDLSSDKAQLRHQVVPPDEILRPLAQALFADLRDQHPDGAQATDRLAMALISRLLLREHHRAAGPARHGLELAREHIDAHLQSPLALEDLAGVAGMSVFHFCRVFREHMAITPHQYIVLRRIEQAKRLLWAHGSGADKANPSMLEIALACGFNTPSHFAAQFRRHTGQTPLQWQRMH